MKAAAVVNIPKPDPVEARRLIGRAIRKLELDLRGLTVLTEAATGMFVVTPLVAALAGADRVLCLTGESQYGTAAQAIAQTKALARRWGVAKRIEFLAGRRDRRIAQADIVTNLRFVRPLDKPMLSRIKPGAVIPLMFETWEYRPQDLDLTECRRRNICVLGTYERDPWLDIFGYIGPLAIRLARELGVSVRGAKSMIVGGGFFGDSAVRAFRRAGTRVVHIQPARGQSLGSRRNRTELSGCDLLVFVEHQDRRRLLGPGGTLTVAQLRKIRPAIRVVHICGGVDGAALTRAGIAHRPQTIAPAGHMSVTPAYLGPQPVIDLHAAGLKVGQAMAEGMRKFGDTKQAVAYALKYSPAMDFEP